MKPTSDLLAEALKEAGASSDIIALARAGYYDDYKSPLATPIVQLASDLRKAGHNDLAERTIRGEFDAQSWESDEWVLSETGRRLLQNLAGDSEIEEPAVNLEKVYVATKYIFQKYAEFANECLPKNDGITRVDAFMIGHNFHCWVLDNLAKSMELSDEQTMQMRQDALETFRHAMENRPI